MGQCFRYFQSICQTKNQPLLSKCLPSKILEFIEQHEPALLKSCLLRIFREPRVFDNILLASPDDVRLLSLFKHLCRPFAEDREFTQELLTKQLDRNKEIGDIVKNDDCLLRDLSRIIRNASSSKEARQGIKKHMQIHGTVTKVESLRNSGFFNHVELNRQTSLFGIEQRIALFLAPDGTKAEDIRAYHTQQA